MNGICCTGRVDCICSDCIEEAAAKVLPIYDQGSYASAFDDDSRQLADQLVNGLGLDKAIKFLENDVDRMLERKHALSIGELYMWELRINIQLPYLRNRKRKEEQAS